MAIKRITDRRPVITEFVAGFDGECAHCYGAIFDGDVIGYLEDEIACGECILEHEIGAR